MNLNKLQYFLSVAECLNFTEAARRHYISQTAMSQQILALEQELGVTLFHRSRRQVTLTPAGTALVAEAQKLLAQYDSLLETLSPFGRRSSGYCASTTPARWRRSGCVS